MLRILCYTHACWKCEYEDTKFVQLRQKSINVFCTYLKKGQKRMKMYTVYLSLSETICKQFHLLAFCFCLLTTNNRKPMIISVYSLFQNYSDIQYKFVLNHKCILTKSRKLFFDKRVSHLDP